MVSANQKLFKKTVFFCISLVTAAVLQAQAAEETDFIHKVTELNHLTQIRDEYCDPSVSPQQIAAYNQLSNADLIHPGDMIQLKASWLKVTALPIKVIVFSGDVQLQKAHSRQRQALSSKHTLAEGDVLSTGENSLVKLRFADDSVVDLQPNGVMRIVASHQPYHSQTMQIVVELTQGRTEVLANPAHKASRQFKVKTPSAVAVVRGTTFRVGAQSGKTLEETLDGAVELAVNADKVQVDKGFGSLAEQGKPPLPPIALPPAPAVDGFNRLFEHAPVNFSIAPQATVAATEVQISEKADFSSLLSTQRVAMHDGNQGLLQLGAIADGQYYLKLRSENNKGLQSEDVVHAFTVDVYPLTPEPVTSAYAPSVGVPLAWTRIQGQTDYVLQLSADATFEQVSFEKALFYNSFYLTPALIGDAQFWRVGIHTEQNTLKFSKPVQLSQTQ